MKEIPTTQENVNKAADRLDAAIAEAEKESVGAKLLRLLKTAREIIREEQSKWNGD